MKSRASGRRRRGPSLAEALILTLSNAKNLPYTVTWFANAALKYGINKSVEAVGEEGLSRNELEVLASFYSGFIQEEIRNRGQNEVCRDWLPLTSNDRRGSFDPCAAVKTLNEVLRGERLEPIRLPPALSLEFAEYIRPSRLKRLKRDVVLVDATVHALASLGAFVTRAYTVRRGNDQEWGYVYVDTEFANLDDYRELHLKCRSVVRSVTLNEGSRQVMLVRLAAAIALSFGAVRREAGIFVDSLRLVGTGRKVMLKAFERIELLGLAGTLARLKISPAVYELAVRYPGRERKEERTVRDFVERLARAILVYHSLGDKGVEELYGVLRALSEGEDSVLYRAGRTLYGDRWDRIIGTLLSVAV
jgi:hypothetical protein